MLDRNKYPYTAAWHIFNTLFPVVVQRKMLMTTEEVQNNVLILTTFTGTEAQWQNEIIEVDISIARMAKIHYTGGIFGISKAEIYAKEIYELLTHHLRQWEEAHRGFIRNRLDEEVKEGLLAFDLMADDVLKVAKEYGATRATFTDDKFMKAFRSTTDLMGKLSGRVLTSEKIIEDLKHNPFAAVFQM